CISRNSGYLGKSQQKCFDMIHFHKNYLQSIFIGKILCVSLSLHVLVARKNSHKWHYGTKVHKVKSLTKRL
ncbi:MAG: hypothetical protein M1292_04425, partial [Bacteroidetes bacterium]|nr:hypothetical protein [Bacteroidota bacterium]